MLFDPVATAAELVATLAGFDSPSIGLEVSGWSEVGMMVPLDVSGLDSSTFSKIGSSRMEALVLVWMFVSGREA